MKKALIIGFGRFGQLLAKLLESDFDILVIEPEEKRRQQAIGQKYAILEMDQISQADYIFLAVPISQTEELIKSIASFVKPGQLVMDVCSVKVHPANLMKTHLSKCQLMATHPMFGPDSAKNGLPGLKIVLCPLNIDNNVLEFWKGFWQEKGLQAIITTPEQHDKEAVYSQAFTYTLAKMVNLMQIPNIEITTKSFEAIKMVATYSANDSPQLFHDMLFYNPYFSQMKDKLGQVMKEVSGILDEIWKSQKQSN